MLCAILPVSREGDNDLFKAVFRGHSKMTSPRKEEMYSKLVTKSDNGERGCPQKLKLPYTENIGCV